MAVRRKLAKRDYYPGKGDLNLADIGRSLASERSGKPIGRDLVWRVLLGKATSSQVKLALERELESILVPGNKHGWWPGKQK